MSGKVVTVTKTAAKEALECFYLSDYLIDAWAAKLNPDQWADPPSMPYRRQYLRWLLEKLEEVVEEQND